jgi:iron complex transport system substrate-binding protein
MRTASTWRARAGLLAWVLCLSAPASAADLERREITDAAGRHVSIPATVTRVADPWHANNAMVLMLGGADKLVATTVQAKNQPWLRRLYPRIDLVPAPFDAAGDVNMEGLIGARPDVILMAYDGSQPKWLGAAEAYHMPVVLMPNTSLEGLKSMVLLTGEVLGPAELKAAHEFVRYFDGNIQRVLAITRALTAAARPKVLHTASAGVLNIDGRQTVIDDWITIAGGVNAATVIGNGRPVTMEQVAAWNPDVIIVGSAPNAQNRQAILEDPRWREISAVKAGKVFVNPSGAYLWDRHSAEAALQVLWAAKLLHPAEFSSIDISKETKLFYARFFHHELTDAEVASILTAMPP